MKNTRAILMLTAMGAIKQEDYVYSTKHRHVTASAIRLGCDVKESENENGYSAQIIIK